MALYPPSPPCPLHRLRPAVNPQLRQKALRVVTNGRQSAKPSAVATAPAVVCRPAPSQELAAEQANMPFSTFRRHLKEGIQRITAELWARESSGG